LPDELLQCAGAQYRSDQCFSVHQISTSSYMCRLFSSARRIVYALLPTIWLVD